MTGTVVKFPTRRIADARHVIMPIDNAGPEVETLEQAWRSVIRAKKALEMQERSVVARFQNAVAKAAAEQTAQRRDADGNYTCAPVDRRQSREILRAILDKWDTEADEPDGAA